MIRKGAKIADLICDRTGTVYVLPFSVCLRFVVIVVVVAFFSLAQQWNICSEIPTSRLDINSKGLAVAMAARCSTTCAQTHSPHSYICTNVQTADDSNSNVATTDNKNTIQQSNVR